jgi:molybdopterin converting factor small subunit
MIEVRLFATLRQGRGKILYLEPEKLAEAGQVLQQLGIPEEDVAIFLINGFHSKLTAPVKDSDVLAIFPPVGGG